MRDGLRAAAVLTVRDGARWLPSTLDALRGEGLDVVVVDHSSADATAAIARARLGAGVLDVVTTPWEGVFSLRAALRAERGVMAGLDHDWVLHVDVDEWPHAPGPGTLRDLLAEADAAGATAVAFEEFTFVPLPEVPEGADHRRTLTTYYAYRFAPGYQRAWRRDAGLDNVDGAGHRLAGEPRVHATAAVLRHYPVLGAAHGHAKYARRVFDPAELGRDWHTDRVGLPPGAFVVRPSPALRTLPRWDARVLDRGAEVDVHFWQPGWAAGPDG